MPIILARTAGFCYGVRRAMKLALLASQKKIPRLFTLGPLIHNQQAIDLLKSRGLCMARDMDDLEKGSRVLIRAHGVPPDVKEALEERCAEVSDATCPHVTAAQRIVEKHAGAGYSCIIIGDRGHAEVDGLLGYAAGRGHVVESEEDVKALPDMERVCIVSQTTQEAERFEELTGLVKERFGDVLVYKTICEATSQRQRELLDIAHRADVVIVVGGEASANTRRLVEISQGTGTPTIHVQTAEELQLDSIGPRTVVGITAGASTPHWVIRNVVEAIERRQLSGRPWPVRLGVGMANFAIYSSLLLAVGAVFLTFTSVSLMRIPFDSMDALLAFCYVLSMHIINKRLSTQGDERLLFGNLKSFYRHKDALSAIGVCCILIALAAGLFLGKIIAALIILSVILGFLYSLPIIPQKLAQHFRYRKLMDIPGSKDIFMAAAWGFVVVLIPALHRNSLNILPFLLTLVAVIPLVMMRSILLDMRDIEGDIVLGRETLPILLGPRRMKYLVRGILALMFAAPLAGWLSGVTPPFALALCLVPFYLLLNYPLSRRQALYQSLVYDGFLEGQFLLAGVLMFIARHLAS